MPPNLLDLKTPPAPKCSFRTYAVYVRYKDGSPARYYTEKCRRASVCKLPEGRYACLVHKTSNGDLYKKTSDANEAAIFLHDTIKPERSEQRAQARIFAKGDWWCECLDRVQKRRMAAVKSMRRKRLPADLINAIISKTEDMYYY